MKKILSCFIVFAMMLFTFVGCSKNDKDTLEDGVLTVGYTIYDPMNYYDDEGDFVGFDTELALEVGKLLDVEIEFVEINWDNKVMALDSYEIDAGWNGMTITEELKDAMSITDSYLENRQVVVCRKGEESRFDTKEEIKNAKEVVVEAGSAGASAAEGLGIEPITMTAQKDTLLEVKADSNKVAIIDITMAKSLVGEGTSYSDLTYVDVGFENEEFGIGFRKNDTETMNKVNDAIKTLTENGTVDRLLKKYFG